MKRTPTNDDRVPNFIGEAEASDDANTESLVARLRALSGTGNSNGWQWNREEVYAERLQRHPNF